jgi:serine/threonine protein kinase
MSMAVDQSLNLKPGMIIQGKYEIVRCLGAGSMGMVYAVKHLDLQGRILAMKVLFSDVAKDETQAARFKNEIVASYEVNHPNVVRAYDYFRENDMIAYTMEYVSGGDLADRLTEDELLSIDEIVFMLRQMASGVQAIHDAGIIHRDLKPENILLTEHGDVKITDFGIARNLKGPRLTDHGGIVGTFAYVAPEYLEHGKIDIRSDIYSLGVLAYEMITGEAPYNAKNVVEEMHLRLTTDPAPPINLRKSCPKFLSDAIMQALSRDPKTRFSSAKEFFEILSSSDLISSKNLSSEIRNDENLGNAKSQISPRILDSQVDLMLQGLKDSLEDRVHTPVFKKRTLVENESATDVEESYIDLDNNIKNPQAFQAVGISSGSLSTNKIKELEKGLKYRSPMRGSNIVNFSDLYQTLINIVMIISGLSIGLLVIWFFLPGMYVEAKKFIYDLLDVLF